MLERHLKHSTTTTTTHTNQGSGCHIEGPAERFVQVGSPLSLTCVIEEQHSDTTPPIPLLWYHQNNLLHQQDSTQGSVNIKMERAGHRTISRLVVSSVSIKDSGNYTCLPIGATSSIASVTVHVSSDELRAAVHSEDVNGASRKGGTILLQSLLPLLPLLHHILPLLSTLSTFVTSHIYSVSHSLPTTASPTANISTSPPTSYDVSASTIPAFCPISISPSPSPRPATSCP
ncbi:hypothetical protein Pcinc_033280 [Petrolisthes cinctipes]|uniref:Ig-like domain-containing protein n=1 Tax=Petrolisthes cinctipes TaxID=88211 RepID=A0AAE1ESQ8_PETCI|nr:hypothetical protein Pcinc_033280 [Petrolisthes cinctipes]